MMEGLQTKKGKITMKRMIALAGLGTLTAFGGVYNVKLDTSADRVRSPLKVDLERVGTIRPRGVGEIHGSNWRLGC